jgi:hypothetical protein
MITALILFENLLPQVILDNIQKYLPSNDNIHEAIKKYYDIHGIHIEFNVNKIKN